MNESFDKCPLSRNPLTQKAEAHITSHIYFFLVKTPFLKEPLYYGLSEKFVSYVLPYLSEEKKFLLWCVLLEQTLLGYKSIVIAPNSEKEIPQEFEHWILYPYDSVLKMLPTPSDIVERILRMHIVLGKNSGELFGNNIVYKMPSPHDGREIYFNLNFDVIESLVDEISTLGYLNVKKNNSDTLRTTITIKGIQYYNGLIDNTDSNLCFVAMKFGAGNDGRNMEDFFYKTIKPAVDSVKPFEAKIVSSDPSGEKICDKIIADIRKSKFLIVDLTHSNNGAYFEAGFAHALNKEIIYICERKWFQDGFYDKKIEDQNYDYTPKTTGKPLGVHFDIDHFKVIGYDTTPKGYDDLKKDIIAHIEARILK